MLSLQDITYSHPNKDPLFTGINLTLDQQSKAALIGNNGVEKSTLLKIMAGEIVPIIGLVKSTSRPYYIPQIFGQFNQLTVAEALNIQNKLSALHAILQGKVTDENLAALNDDWTIEERCREAMAYWEIENVELTDKLDKLSGGQKTKVFLAGIQIHQPSIVLLDEPSNHLDAHARKLLYNLVETGSETFVIVSHDRKLLDLLNPIYELDKRGITRYGGDFGFYIEQKKLENNAFTADLQNIEKELRKAKEVERDTIQRQQKLDARGKKKQEKAGVPTIAMNTLRNRAENSTANLKSVHATKVGSLTRNLHELRNAIPELDKMKFGFDDAKLHKGKVLFSAGVINYSYATDLWNEPINVEIRSGDRIAIAGKNGSGKTTLIKIILGQLTPTTGHVITRDSTSVYIDQEYALVNNNLTVIEQAQVFNKTGLYDHEVKTRLTRFLFSPRQWNQLCSELSGGEKMRLVLCCLTIGTQAPDMIILDEPTNNLDLQNIAILTTAISDYKGTLLVVSHDQTFLDDININKIISLSST